MSDDIITPKSDSKGKAITSLILGIISILPVLAFLIALLLAVIAPGFMYFGATRGQSIFVLYTGITLIYLSPISILTGIVGIILGKLGLKSTKANLAKIGITLSALGLASSIIYFLRLAAGF